MLARSPHIVYLYEPFSPEGWEPLMAPTMERWFTRVDAGNEAALGERVDRLMALEYPWRKGLERVRNVRDAMYVARRATYFGAMRSLRGRPLLKAPIALLSADWISERYGTDTIVMIRHPAAFVLSSLRMGYFFDFKNFTEQPGIMDGVLQEFRDEITHYAHTEHDALENAAVHWKHLHHVIRGYRERFPHWRFVIYEDLALHPMEGFRALYDHVGLDYDRAAQRHVRAYSLSSHESRDEGQQHRLIRDSRLSAWSWKHTIEPTQLARIRALTDEVARDFYPPSTWSLDTDRREVPADGLERVFASESLFPVPPSI